MGFFDVHKPTKITPPPLCTNDGCSLPLGDTGNRLLKVCSECWAAVGCKESGGQGSGVLGYWGKGAKRAYHHTAPVNTLYGLHESLVMLTEEGLENSWTRHHENHLLLKDGLCKLGIHYLVDESSRLPQLNSVYIPEGSDDAKVRSTLINDFNIEIGAGLGDLADKIWRIGLMGHTSRKENVDLCLAALQEAL